MDSLLRCKAVNQSKGASMVPASDDHKDTPEVDSSASMKERKNSRLTPMPDYLMHW